jgi:hypothetical protein
MINGSVEDADAYDLWRPWFAFGLTKGEDSKSYSGG